jgi:hypothetical protein
MSASHEISGKRPPGTMVKIKDLLWFRPYGEEHVKEYEVWKQHPIRSFEVSRFRTTSWSAARDYRNQGWVVRALREEEIPSYIFPDGRVTYSLSDGRRVEACFDENGSANVDFFTVNGVRNRVVLSTEAFVAMRVVLQSMALFKESARDVVASTSEIQDQLASVASPNAAAA